MDEPMCLYKGKLKEAMTLVKGMSQDTLFEAVAYWNTITSQLDQMINSGQSAPVTYGEQPGTPFNTLNNCCNGVHNETDRYESFAISPTPSNAIANSTVTTPANSQTNLLHQNNNSDKTIYGSIFQNNNLLENGDTFDDLSSNDPIAITMSSETISNLPTGGYPTTYQYDNDVFSPNLEVQSATITNHSNRTNYLNDGNTNLPADIDNSRITTTTEVTDCTLYGENAKAHDEDVYEHNEYAPNATITLDPSTFRSYGNELSAQRDLPLQQIQVPHDFNGDLFASQTQSCDKLENCPCDMYYQVISNDGELERLREPNRPENNSLSDEEIEDPLNIMGVKREIVSIIESNSLNDYNDTNDCNCTNYCNVTDDVKSNTCEICGKSGFSTKGNMMRHVRAHSGEKPFKCDYCDSCFTEKKSLKIHVRRHTGEKPYKCQICSKVFSQTGVLQSHMSCHRNERKFECEKCGKAFRQRSQLKLHVMRHDGVKRLECSTCWAKFLTKGDLERHRRIHTGERPYTCEVCEKTFTRQQSLNEHMNRHMNRKPYDCKHCDKTFSEMSACYKHVKTHREHESQSQLSLTSQ